jgi:hypothetical protein
MVRDNKHWNQQELRREQQLRRLNTRNPDCDVCGESEPAALIKIEGRIICYECKAKALGKSTAEWHHYAGKNNDSFSVPVHGNDHRVLSDYQRDWPTETLRNPNASPLLKAAASLRGWLDILRLLIERILGWIPPFLESLDGHLSSVIGEQWWVNLDLKGELK